MKGLEKLSAATNIKDNDGVSETRITTAGRLT